MTNETDVIGKALADWRPELNRIINKLETPELLAQLAEEAAELSKAALKLRRALDGKNPTPISPADAILNVQEKMAGVLLCVLSVGFDEQFAERTIRAKIPRWSGRIDHDPDSDCPKESYPHGKRHVALVCGECHDKDCETCQVWLRATGGGRDV